MGVGGCRVLTLATVATMRPRQLGDSVGDCNYHGYAMFCRVCSANADQLRAIQSGNPKQGEHYHCVRLHYRDLDVLPLQEVRYDWCEHCVACPPWFLHLDGFRSTYSVLFFVDLHMHTHAYAYKHTYSYVFTICPNNPRHEWACVCKCFFGNKKGTLSHSTRARKEMRKYIFE